MTHERNNWSRPRAVEEATKWCGGDHQWKSDIENEAVIRCEECGVYLADFVGFLYSEIVALRNDLDSLGHDIAMMGGEDDE